MKPLLLPCAAGLLLGMGGIGCEMHSPSQTVEGYEKKEVRAEVAEQRNDSVPEPVNPNPPSFFRSNN